MKASTLIEKLSEHPDWEVHYWDEYKEYAEEVWSVHEYNVNGDGQAHDDEELEEVKADYKEDGIDFSEAGYEKGYVLM